MIYKYKLALFFILIQIILSASLNSKFKDSNQAGNISQCCADDHTISVTGSSSIASPTNKIRIGLSVVTKENLASDSLNSNNEISTALGDIFKNMSIAQQNITTYSFQIDQSTSQIYNSGNSTYSTIYDGYSVTNKLDVCVPDLLTASMLIDRAVSAGVKNIDYVIFEIDDDTAAKIKKDLITSAVANALEKATLAGDSAGITIKDVKSIDITNYTTPPSSTAYAASSFDRSASTTLYSGSNVSSLNVNVVFIVSKK